MRVLYLGANLRMSLTAPSAPEIRALGLKQGLEEAGATVIPLMAGDQVDVQRTQAVYSKGLKRFLPPGMTHALRDAYEMLHDRKLYRAVRDRVREIRPDVLLQKHTRYGQAGIRLGREYGIPVFLDDITPLWEGEQYGDRSLKPLARHIRKRAFSQARGLIAVSRDMETELRSEGAPRQRIHFVPNGVDPVRFNPDTASLAVRQRYNLEGKLVVGYAGGFAGWHRLDFFMRVISSLAATRPDLHVLMVGHDREGRVASMARRQGLGDRFTLSGDVPHAEVPAYLKAMDIAVLPHTLHYMSPIKIYEYMAMARAVVAPTGNSTTEEVIAHGRNGLLFEAGNEDAFGEAIVTLAADPSLRRSLGVEARNTAETHFTWRRQADRLLQAFQSTPATSPGQADCREIGCGHEPRETA